MAIELLLEKRIGLLDHFSDDWHNNFNILRHRNQSVALAFDMLLLLLLVFRSRLFVAAAVDEAPSHPRRRNHSLVATIQSICPPGGWRCSSLSTVRTSLAPRYGQCEYYADRWLAAMQPQTRHKSRHHPQWQKQLKPNKENCVKLGFPAPNVV